MTVPHNEWLSNPKLNVIYVTSQLRLKYVDTQATLSCNETSRNEDTKNIDMMVVGEIFLLHETTIHIK